LTSDAFTIIGTNKKIKMREIPNRFIKEYIRIHQNNESRVIKQEDHKFSYRREDKVLKLLIKNEGMFQGKVTVNVSFVTEKENLLTVNYSQ